ncbi:MAG TPA: DUF2795 domain-containing protein [Pseudonocardia sp.]|nr:DUF2795 domain-containing protein [Pseudonocardia sp.]
MYRRSPLADVRRLGQVLADAEFPAAKWQLIMHGEAYGADASTRAQLWSLPVRTYADLAAVLAALGLAAGPPASAPAGSGRPRSGELGPAGH